MQAMTHRPMQNNEQEMEAKSTQELLEIWNCGDRSAWSDETFDVVRRILLRRLGSLPPQAPLVQEISVADQQALDNAKSQLQDVQSAENVLVYHERQLIVSSLFLLAWYLSVYCALILVLILTGLLVSVLSGHSEVLDNLDLPWVLIVGAASSWPFYLLQRQAARDLEISRERIIRCLKEECS